MTVKAVDGIVVGIPRPGNGMKLYMPHGRHTSVSGWSIIGLINESLIQK